MSRVYVPQLNESRNINILPASEFGELVICWEGKQLILNAFSCIRKIRKSMRDAKEGDYLLCIGDPAVIAICAIILHEMTNGRFNILKWDRQTKTYYSIVLDSDEEDEYEQ